MSVKIKISYEQPGELEQIIKLLQPVIKSYSLSGNREGRYKKAYVELREKPERTAEA